MANNITTTLHTSLPRPQRCRRPLGVKVLHLRVLAIPWGTSRGAHVDNRVAASLLLNNRGVEKRTVGERTLSDEGRDVWWGGGGCGGGGGSGGRGYVAHGPSGVGAFLESHGMLLEGPTARSSQRGRAVATLEDLADVGI